MTGIAECPLGHIHKLCLVLSKSEGCTIGYLVRLFYVDEAGYLAPLDNLFLFLLNKRFRTLTQTVFFVIVNFLILLITILRARGSFTTFLIVFIERNYERPHLPLFLFLLHNFDVLTLFLLPVLAPLLSSHLLYLNKPIKFFNRLLQAASTSHIDNRRHLI